MFASLRYRRRARNIILITLVLALIYVIIPKSSTRSHSPTRPHSLLSSRSPQIQYSFPASASADVKRLGAVKEEFLHAYDGYKTHAWGRDVLNPISGTYSTEYCGWASTLIDTLDTLYIMELYDEFEEAVQAVTRLSHLYAPSLLCSINPFEMTIRHLGGLLSAYDISGSRDDRLKKKAIQFGEMLIQSFGHNGIPCKTILWPRLSIWPCKSSPSLSLARLGSQNLEFLRLSTITGNPKWANKIRFLSKELSRLQDSSNMPGLWPKFLDGSCDHGLCDKPPSGTQWFTLGSGTDSTYEYLPKTHLLYGHRDGIYLTMWRKALTQIRKHMLFQPMSPNNTDHIFPALLSSNAPSKYTLLGKMEHLECFLGGTLALSSRIANSSDDPDADLRIAENITNACVWAYSTFPSGIAPDQFWMVPCPQSPLDCPWNAGTFAVRAPRRDPSLPMGVNKVERSEYLLRPEAIESVFVLYRLTGKEIWREHGWNMFTAIRNATRTRYGHAGLSDTRKADGGEKIDKMESFWLSETLKYFYLLFSDPKLVSLDDWVFSTEGHPLRLRTDI